MNGDETTPRILIVDDDENYLASIRRVLHGQCEILTTKDPLQALKIIEHQGPFAVVISDYRMPVMNGIELFSRILTIDKQVQRILLTGYPELQMAIDAVNHGKITAFLTKPTPSVSLRSVVLEAAQNYKDSLQSSGQRQDFPEAADKQPVSDQSDVKLFAPLTVKEKEVLTLVAKGYSNAEISTNMTITVGTVKTHINNLFWKMDVNSRTKMIAKAIELGLIKT
ncbi:DNA-binding response regulator [Anaeroselena agilis]|uniref:DNA-binding response regulator n=1 Tax=Anaeroselena agilis TaxID=3063788 RepID=A0ABU3NSV1_9FIRM|nr:DNA-binding response regulator [Selenomonadales bacterium 4137-cl]